MSAAAWLRDTVSREAMEGELHLNLDEEDEVLGFISVRRAEWDVATRIRHRLSMRRILRGKSDLDGKVQPGLLIDWIARSASSEPGYGQTLFDYAIALALSVGAIAVIVEPHDASTRRMWVEHYGFQPVEQASVDGAQRLWFPAEPLDPPTFQ